MEITAPTPVQPAEVTAKALLEQTAAGASAVTQSWTDDEKSRLRMLANQHESVNQIAGSLGKSVSAVLMEAATLGLNLNAVATNNSSVGNSGIQAIGNNVNVNA